MSKSSAVKSAALKALLVFSVCLAAFGYGMTVARYEVFPYAVLRDAKQALVALLEVYVRGGTDAENTRELLHGPQVRCRAEIANDGLILVAGGAGYMRLHSPQDGCLAWLMDRAGKVRHVWHYRPDVWKDLRNVATVPGQTVIYPVGLHLYEDGGLLVSYQGRNCFPFAIGLARFDRESNLLWKRETLSHHWFSVAPDGRIFTPALRVVDSPVTIGETGVTISTDKQKVLSDTIMILDPDGNTLDEIPVLETLCKSGWIGLFQGAPPSGDVPVIDVTTEDPTHLNDVRLVDAEWAANHPLLKPGDMLVSFRSLNAIAILDSDTRRFKWLSAGTTLRQHSPRFWGDGILVFDNLGGSPGAGGARLVSVDMQTGMPHTVFPRHSVPLPARFESRTAGHLDVDRERNHALVSLTEAGAIWEIDLDSGDVLWEYTYAHPNETGPSRQIFNAQYVRKPTFPLNI